MLYQRPRQLSPSCQKQPAPMCTNTHERFCSRNRPLTNTGSPSADTPKLEFPDAFAQWWFQTHLLMATDTRQPGLLNDSVEQGLRRTWQEPSLFHLIISGTLFMCGATCFGIYLTIAYTSFNLLITLTGVHGKGWKSHCIRFHRSETAGKTGNGLRTHHKEEVEESRSMRATEQCESTVG